MANWVGNTVRWARKRAGMTQLQLAEATGMPQPSIARIERGQVNPRTATLIRVLEATGHRLTVEPMQPAPDPKAITRTRALTVPQRTRQALGRSAKNPTTNPLRILKRLRRFGVPFVLIGELAEVAHGAPHKVGRAVEICQATTEGSDQRLGKAIEDLGGTRVDRTTVRTDAGTLHLLTETAAGDDYVILARNAVRMPVDAGIQVPVAALDDLVRIRLARNTPDDRSAAAVLRALGEGRAVGGD